MRNVLRSVLIFLGGLFTVEALYLFLVANFNVGYVIGLAMGLALLAYGIFYGKINGFCKSGLKLWIKRVCVTGIACYIHRRCCYCFRGGSAWQCNKQTVKIPP